MTTPTEKDTLRHSTHMKALAKSDSATAYGQATVMLMGHAVTLAVEMYEEGVKAERKRIVDILQL
jgi:hypothetical protein